jgi:RNA polymerase primary sigma factor
VDDKGTKGLDKVTRLDPLVWAAVEYSIERTLKPNTRARGALKNSEPANQPEIVFPSLAEERLAIRRAICGDANASMQLVKQHRPIVDRMARNYAASVGLSFEDFQSEGNLALLGAIEKFDFERSTRFVSYLQWWLKSAMQESVCDMSAPMRLPRREIGKTVRENKRLVDLSKAQTSEDVRASADTFDQPQSGGSLAEPNAENWSLDASETEPSTELSGDQATSDAHYSSLQQSARHSSIARGVSVDLIDDHCREPDLALDRIEQSQLLALLAGLWPKLTEREQFVLDQYFGLSAEHPASLTDIGCSLSVSRQRATQILDGALLKLKSALAEPLVNSVPRE